jgi:hypothetical protein
LDGPVSAQKWGRKIQVEGDASGGASHRHHGRSCGRFARTKPRHRAGQWLPNRGKPIIWQKGRALHWLVASRRNLSYARAYRHPAGPTHGRSLPWKSDRETASADGLKRNRPRAWEMARYRNRDRLRRPARSRKSDRISTCDWPEARDDPRPPSILPNPSGEIPREHVAGRKTLPLPIFVRATRSYVRFAFESGRATRGRCLCAKPSSDS